MPKLAICATALALAACNITPAQFEGVTGPSVISASVLPATTLAQVQKLCAAAQGPLASVTGPAANTAVYPIAYCQQLSAAPAGQVPATTDANTQAWLQTAIQLAGIALPLLM